MADFVAYHNPERMGGPLRRERGVFGILTKKRMVLGCKGETVWLIQGTWVKDRGKKVRLYTLECRFVIDTVEEITDPDFDFQATGHDGTPFNPPIRLNGLPWFRRFYDLQNNFSLGFNPIDSQTLLNLKTLASGRK